MPDLTPAQRDLLAAVGRGDVRNMWDYDYRRDTRRVVTAAVARLLNSGLVKISTDIYFLTPAGRAALESTPEAPR